MTSSTRHAESMTNCSQANGSPFVEQVSKMLLVSPFSSGMNEQSPELPTLRRKPTEVMVLRWNDKIKQNLPPCDQTDCIVYKHHEVAGRPSFRNDGVRSCLKITRTKRGSLDSEMTTTPTHTTTNEAGIGGQFAPEYAQKIYRTELKN